MRFAIRKKAELEQRRSERMRASLEGRMFLPAKETTVACRVLDLSDGGAGVTAEDMPPLQAFVILYVEGFGRFEAVAARFDGHVLGLRFLLNDRKRKMLVEKLVRYIGSGAMDPTSLRRHRRVADAAAASFVMAAGERVPCEVMDISLTGASLRTHARPLIGATVTIGRMPARVVRYHDRGIAVEFEPRP